MSERNYDNTGAGSAPANYIKIDSKKAEFVIGDKSSPGFSGYFERLSMEWRKAIPEQQLPPRWEIKVFMSAKDPDDNTVKEYQVGISSHWKSPVMGNVLNALLGSLMDQGWNRYIRFFLFTKDAAKGGLPYCNIVCYKSASKEWSNYGYPFDEATKSWVGVPTEKEAETMFWLGVAKHIAGITGGTVIGEDNQKIHPVSVIATPASPVGTTPQPSPQQPQEDPLSSQSLSDKYKAAIKSRVAKFTGPSTPDYAIQANMLYNDLMSKPETDPARFGMTPEVVQAEIVLKLTERGIPGIYYNGNMFTVPAVSDDLPF